MPDTYLPTKHTITLINAPRSLRAAYPTTYVRTCHSDTCGCFSHPGGYYETAIPTAAVARLVRVPGNVYEHARHVWASSREPRRISRGPAAASRVQSFLAHSRFLSEREQGVFVADYVAAVDAERGDAPAILDDGVGVSRRREEEARRRKGESRRRFSDGFCNPLAPAMAAAGLA